MEPKEINYAGNQKIYNKEKIDYLLDELNNSLSESINQKQDTLTFDDEPTAGSDNPVKSNGIATAITDEADKRLNADNKLDTKIGELSSLETTAKTNIVSAINEIKRSVPEKDTIDSELDENSSNAVQNKAIVEGISSAIEPLDDSIANIQETLENVLPADIKPTESSKKLVESGGTFDAIRFASTKVGETMYWYKSKKETREVHSDNPFNFTINGQDYSVTTNDSTVDICISDEIPDGWHALDGKAELMASDYPDLAEFMPDNITTDGKIWLPYVKQKIIKVRY